MLYNFEQKQIPGPGTGNYAFLPGFPLPSIGPFGPATPYSMQWRVMQPEKPYYNQAQYLIGLIGIVAGQAAHQPLLDTRSQG